jgi:anti-sigma regulatory factor (Ser/Thr protein kinase)
LTSRAEVELDAVPASVAAARRFVSSTLAAWDLDDLAEVALLLTSEVVTNAIRHARTVVTLTVSLRPPEVVVEVADQSAAPPAPTLATHERESGRGLHLVDSLATTWGWRPEGAGKVVWFALTG